MNEWNASRFCVANSLIGEHAQTTNKGTGMTAKGEFKGKCFEVKIEEDSCENGRAIRNTQDEGHSDSRALNSATNVSITTTNVTLDAPQK